MTRYTYEDLALHLRTGSDEEPNLVDRAKKRSESVEYVVLEAAADHARLRSFHDDGSVAVVDEPLDGDHEYIHEAVSGGPSHLRHAHHTEEVWERNARLFASGANKIVAAGGIDLLFVTGDPHVVDIVTEALSFESSAVLITLAIDTVAPGASEHALNRRIDEEIRRIRSTRLQTGLDGLLTQASVHSHTGLDAVVAELQEASVATLFVDEGALDGITLLAMPDRPWIAPSSDSARPETPAVEALVRAAILTGSELAFVASGSLPGGAAVAAITRWAPDGQPAATVDPATR